MGDGPFHPFALPPRPPNLTQAFPPDRLGAMKSIVVVCTGNICRSPMGEVVLAKRLARAGIEAEVTSAGVSSEESGHPIDRRAANVLRDSGYDVPSHRAHRISDDELRSSDLILAMTTGHARRLRSMAEAAGADLGKIRLWREFDGTTPPSENGVFGPGGALAPDGSHAHEAGKRHSGSDLYWSDGALDVPDPYYDPIEGFQATLATVERGADGIVSWLRAREG